MKIVLFLSMVACLACLVAVETTPKDDGANHLAEAFNVGLVLSKLVLTVIFVDCFVHAL